MRLIVSGHAPSRCRIPVALSLLALAACSAGVGCGRPETAADRQLARLSDGVGSIQAEQDRAGRLDMLDDDDDGRAFRTDAPAGRSSRAPLASPAPLAPMRTVQIGAVDDAPTESDDPNAPGERVEIRLQGSGMSSRSARARRARDDDRAEPVASDTTSKEAR